MLANHMNYMQQPMAMPSSDFSVAAPTLGGVSGATGGGLGRSVPSMYGNVPSLPPMQAPGTISPSMAAFFAAMNRGNNQSPIYGGYNMPQGFPPMAHTGGALPPMAMPSMYTGGAMPAMRMGGNPTGGYDSSGINPGGGALPQPFPQNPGGFQPLRNLGFGGR